MSYKVEVTAGSVSELAGKLLALAATMQAIPSDPVMPEVKAADAKPKRTSKAGKVEEVAAETATGTGSTTKTEAAAPQPAETPTEATPASAERPAAEAEPAKTLDFDKDVAPVVLAAVKNKGREWVQEILSQFGVARASQVPDEQFAELVATLSEGAQ